MNTNDLPVKNIRTDLLYPELSYKIVGALFEVFNKLGPGYLEKYYQRAIAVSLKEVGLKFKEQLYAPLIFKEVKIGKCFFDFLVEDKIVLELKTGDRFSKKDIEQIHYYLKINKLQLGLLINFTSQCVRFKRILNKN